MIRNVFFISFFVLLSSCSKQKDTNTACDEDYEIVSATFDRLPYEFVPVISIPDSVEDEVQNEPEPEPIDPEIAAIADTLKIATAYFTGYFVAVNGKNSYQLPKPEKIEVSADYKGLYKQMLLFKNKSDTLDVKRITNTSYYRLKPSRLGDEDKFGIHDISLHYSRIAYNQDRTKACLYVETGCGPMCASGDLLFMEKIKGKWKIAKKINIWIA